MAVENGVKNMQAAAYNGALTVYVFVKFNTVCEHKKRGGRVGHDGRQDPPECEIQDENENYSRGSV